MANDLNYTGAQFVLATLPDGGIEIQALGPAGKLIAAETFEDMRGVTGWFSQRFPATALDLGYCIAGPETQAVLRQRAAAA